MATVTIKNVSSAAVYVRDLQDTIEAGETISFSRSLGDLTGMNALNGYINDGTLQVISVVTTDAETFWATGGAPIQSASAVTLYVATTGSNTNNGLTADKPLLTISAALAKCPLIVRAGKPVTIVVAAGTYTNSIVTPPSPLTIDANVTVEGAAMVATAPAQGIASGTFDAAFGTQAFPHRALITGAGWAVGGLRGGFFIEILDGTLVGNLYPVVNNAADTLDVAFPCNTGTLNLQGRQFRLVKPSTIIAPSGAVDTISATARISASGTMNSATGSIFLTFSKMEIRRAGSSNLAVRVANGASVRFSACSFLDVAGGGGSMVQATFGATLRLDDTLAYRGAATNTNLVSVSSLSSFIGNRVGSYGGNTPLSITQSSFSMTNAFFAGSDGGLSLLNTNAVVFGFASDACTVGVLVTGGTVAQLSSCVIKNATFCGVLIGINTATLTSAAFSSGFVNFFGTTIDTCVRGVVLGLNSSASFLATSASTVSNNSAFGVDAAVSLRCGHNTVSTVSNLVMTGNGADFTLDGSTGLSLAALRALSPKRSVDAASFNRVVEV